MKISIDKMTITLENVQAAKEMAVNENWIDAETIKNCASEILTKYYGSDVYAGFVIKAPALAITMNHYEMTVYARDAYIEYWHDGFKLALMSFDVLRVCRGEAEAFLRIFGESFSGCI